MFIKTPSRCYLIELLDKDKFSSSHIYEGIMGLVGKFMKKEKHLLQLVLFMRLSCRTTRLVMNVRHEMV